MPTWAYAVLGFFALIVAGTIGIRLRFRWIASSRPGENFDAFRSSFAEDEAPIEVLSAVYAEFQDWCSDSVAAFPVRAANHIGRTYGMVDEDLDDAVLAVVAELGRRFPPAEQLCKVQPVITVRDFVRFVAACPKSTERDAALERNSGSTSGGRAERVN